MLAIVRDRSRSLTLEPDQELWIDRIPGLEPGSELVFDQVQLLRRDDGSVAVGRPVVEGAKVLAEVLGEVRDRKLHVRTFRRRKSSRRHLGHRQTYTRIRVREIQA